MAKKLHLVHVKSNVLDKAPSASTLNYGEIAVNYNHDTPTLYIKDNDEHIVKFPSGPHRPRMFYGTCSTAASGVTKTVVCPAFTSSDLVKGVIVYVTFDNTNTGAVGSLKMNVNGTGDLPVKKIYINTIANLVHAGEIIKDQTYMFQYDGTNWVCMTLDYNNTYALTNLPEGSGNYIADSPIYRYQMLFQKGGDERNELTPLNNSNNVTATGKTMLTNVEFDAFGKIYYYSTTTTVNKDTRIATGYLNYHHAGFDLRYTFNVTTTSFNTNDPLYLVVSPQSNGLVKLASALPLTQTLPSTDDGYWYIFLGRMYSKYQLTLYTEHPVYRHNGTELIQVLNPEIAAGLKNNLEEIVGTGITDTSGETYIPLTEVIKEIEKIVGTGVTETSGETLIPLSEIIQEDELAIAAALNDLHSDVVDLDARKIETLTVTGSGNVVSTIEKVGTELFVTLTEAGDSFIVDSALTSSSTNAVENRAIYDAIVKDEKVTAAAINDLNDRKADLVDVTQLFTELEGDIDDMWDRISDIEGLPAVTAADNGKMLKVVDGVWTLVDPVTVYSGTQTPPTTLGANGDVYLQTS